MYSDFNIVNFKARVRYPVCTELPSRISKVFEEVGRVKRSKLDSEPADQESEMWILELMHRPTINNYC